MRLGLSNVPESEKALLVPVSTKGIMAAHERGNWMKNTVNKIHIEFNNFTYSGLDTISLRTMRRGRDCCIRR